MNVANTIASNYRIPTKVNNLPQKESEHNFLIESFVKSVYKQTFSEVEGLHSVFGSYGISAVSIVGVPSKKSNPKIDLRTLAIFIELCYRSLNNILEKLHQSYFLYYLLSPNKFMSVAFYMPISGCFIFSMIFLALKEYFRKAGYGIPKALIYNHILSLGFYFLTIFVFLNSNIDKDIEKYVLLGGPITLVLLNFLYPLKSPAECVVLRFVLFAEVGLLIGATSLLSISPGLIIGACSTLPIILLLGILKSGSM